MGRILLPSSELRFYGICPTRTEQPTDIRGMKHRCTAAVLLTAFVLASCDGAADLAKPVDPGARTVASPTCPATAHTDDRIEIISPTPGATVRWRRIDDPDHRGFRIYEEPVLVLDGGIEAIATSADGDTSEPTSCAILLTTDSTLATPVLTPAYDTFEYALDSIEITSDVPGAVIRYTLDGSDVDTSSPVWSGPLALPRSGSLVVKAFASAPGWHASRMIRRVFTAGAAPWNPAIRYDSIVDRRTGLAYPIVSMGQQDWFAKNLFLPRRTSYDHLPTSGTAYEPAELKKDSLAPLCPDGWRIPSREDWEILAGWIRSSPVPSGLDPFLAAGKDSTGDPFGFRFLPSPHGSYWSGRFLDGLHTSALGRPENGFWTTTLVEDSLVLASPSLAGIEFRARPDTLPHEGDRFTPRMVPAAPIRCVRTERP